MQIIWGGKVSHLLWTDRQPWYCSSEITGMDMRDYHGAMELWMFSSELQLSSTTAELFHLKQLATYDTYKTYIRFEEELNRTQWYEDILQVDDINNFDGYIHDTNNG